MDPKKEVVFIDGMRWWKPRDGAPDFVKGNISIDPVKLIEFMKTHKEAMSEKGYFSVDVKKSKAGEIYLQLNTFKKDSISESVVADDVPF